MKLYTKTGDDGSTGLFGGDRVPKNDPRVTAYGEVDELNAVIGMVIASCDDEKTNRNLQQIQSELFTLGAQLATPEHQKSSTTIQDKHIKQLEEWIDEAVAEVEPMKNFILPGGTVTAAGLHLARTVCRRAERATITLSQQQSVDPQTIIYLNRLSDLLFAQARDANKRDGVEDIPWIAPKDEC